jgi:hypothetical protein
MALGYVTTVKQKLGWIPFAVQPERREHGRKSVVQTHQSAPINMRPVMKQILCLSSMAILCALVTGCPSNDYTVELAPQADGTIERTLTFFRAGGSGTNGVSSYEAFPSNELASITGLYPAGAVKANGLRYVATGDFAGSMPQDVGGAGSYTNFATTLGDAGFYMERFRGTNDLAGEAARRIQAADQIDDLLIGWSQTRFGHERGYKNLHKFLDGDFRRDLKNAGLYAWMGEVNSLSETNNPNEFIFRFIQYLYERGYLKLSDTRDIYLLLNDKEDPSNVQRLVQRLLMEKMDIPSSSPVPQSFAILDDPDALEKSWEKYLAETDLYRAQVKQWQSETNANPTLVRPKPEDIANDLFANLFFGSEALGGTPDHLTVKLKLTHAPDFTNGKWQDGQVVWSEDLDPNRPLPVLCYAGWSNPNTEFQSKHFGSVILDGASLSQYCFWQGTIGPEQARQWESFLANLKPGPELKTNLEHFQFVGEVASAPAMVKGKEDYADVGRKLLVEALGNEK